MACFYIFIFIFYTNNFISYLSEESQSLFYPNKSLDLIKLLESNTNYIYEYKKGYLKNSDTYKSYNVKLKSLPNKPNNINEFMESAYNNSLFNIAMGCIFIEEIENMDIKSFNVYITQIFTGSNAYLFANTMLFISSFLKNEYDIDASILTNIEILENNFNKDEGNEENRKKVLDMFFLFGFAISSLIGYIIFLSGLIQDKIKERITNIKHLLYLSGCNMWSYWISFFIIDYLKLFIFNLILFISAYFIN